MSLLSFLLNLTLSHLTLVMDNFLGMMDAIFTVENSHYVILIIKLASHELFYRKIVYCITTKGFRNLIHILIKPLPAHS